MLDLKTNRLSAPEAFGLELNNRLGISRNGLTELNPWSKEGRSQQLLGRVWNQFDAANSIHMDERISTGRWTNLYRPQVKVVLMESK